MTLNRGEQSRQALSNGNAIRLGHAALRAELHDARLSFRKALDDPRAQSMSIWKLVGYLPAWGPIKVNDLSLALIRARVMIGYGACVRSLTARQRLALLGAVEKPAKKPPKPAKRKPKAPPLDAPPRCLCCKARLRTPADLCQFCAVELERGAA